MISKIFGKKTKEEEKDPKLKELDERIAKMKLTELGSYVKGKIDTLEVSEEGLVAVLERLVSKINDNRYFLDASDDDTKLKKAFELVLLVAKNKKVTLKAMEIIATFKTLYEPLIKAYDKKYKEIYADRLDKAVENAMVIVEAKVSLQNKMNVLE